MNTNEKLGFKAEDRLLIINADDYGMCHSANLGIQQLLSEGIVSSATVMMPCSWAKEAVEWAVQNPHANVGVHLTFTSEWQGYKWGPVTRTEDVSSLVTQEGYFPADCKTFEQQADPDQVRAEIISQIEMAKRMGLEPTHLDNHMGSLYGLATGREFLQIVFEVCKMYGLPFRLPRKPRAALNVPPEMEQKAAQIAALADALGVVILDDLVGLSFHAEAGETYDSFKQNMIALLRGLQPGVSELILHPALVTEELKSIHSQWAKRGWEMDIFRDPDVKQTLKDEGIRMIRWSDLRDLQRGNGSRG